MRAADRAVVRALASSSAPSDVTASSDSMLCCTVSQELCVALLLRTSAPSSSERAACRRRNAALSSRQSAPCQPASQRHFAAQRGASSVQRAGSRTHTPWPLHSSAGARDCGCRVLPAHSFSGAGHRAVLHSRVSLAGPKWTQPRPPLAGRGWLQLRLRVCWPTKKPPVKRGQDWEQLPQGPHALYPPSRGSNAGSQSFKAQGSSFSAGPSAEQLSPPLRGTGLSHVRVNSRTPVPQVPEQLEVNTQGE